MNLYDGDSKDIRFRYYAILMLLVFALGIFISFQIVAFISPPL